MTTYRKSAPAPSSLVVHSFPDYADALAFAHSVGAHRPGRRLTAEGLRWQVVTAGPVTRPTFAKVSAEGPGKAPSGRMVARYRGTRCTGLSVEPRAYSGPGVPVDIFRAVYGPILSAVVSAHEEEAPAVSLAPDAWQSAIKEPAAPAVRFPSGKPEAPKTPTFPAEWNKPARKTSRQTAAA